MTKKSKPDPCNLQRKYTVILKSREEKMGKYSGGEKGKTKVGQWQNIEEKEGKGWCT